MMKILQKSGIILVLFFICTVLFAQSWIVEYHVPESNSAESFIRANFRILNNSGDAVSLDRLTIQYWYTREGSLDESFNCWYAQVGSANIIGTFTDVSGSDVDRYCSISFLSGTGTINNGSNTGVIECAWNKTDYSRYNELDDYSYDSSKTNYTAWENVTLYLDGELVWGIEPDWEPTPDPTPSPDPSATPTPTPEPTPVTTGDGTGVGFQLEAEDYIAFHDTSSGNEGNTYRDDDVDIESCSEGGFNVGWIVSGEWLEYSFDVPESDIFNIYVRVASAQGITSGFEIDIDGLPVSGPVDVSETFSWQSWQDEIVSDVSIDSGIHTLRIILNGGFNLNYIYIASITNPPDPTPIPGAVPTSTPPPDYQSVVSRYGQLQVIGTQLCNQDGDSVQLTGMCSHGLQWYPFLKDHTLANLVYDWKIAVIRPAMYIEESKNGDFWGGYMVQPEYMKTKAKEIIDNAIELGIYVLIDWHIHNDPENFTAEATAFYTEMANTYGSYSNIIYEICNEPENVTWAVVKSYANDLIPVIRGIDPDNIILVGTPTWCQDVHTAADDPLIGYSNIMYTMHFYAGSHGSWLRDRGDYALSNGLPLFVSEWGTSDHTGGSDEQVYLTESQDWVDWMNTNNLSWINWNFSNKGEASAALMPGVNIGGPWTSDDLSESGKYVKEQIYARTPEPEVTASPTPNPTESPTPDPTASPTPDPTASPTPDPTASPIPDPTASPSPTPTPVPTESPTPVPTESPTPEVTESPTPDPTESPTPDPTESPTPDPTESPTPDPTASPTPTPTESPTPVPTESPTPVPTESPTPVPTESPTPDPTASPTPTPTPEATASPTPGGNNVLEVELESLSGQSQFSPLVVTSDSSASGGQVIQWPGNGNQILSSASDTADGQVQISFTLSQTANVKFSIQVNMSNGSNDSFYYKMDSGSWSTKNNTKTSGYAVMTPTTYNYLSAGSHTLSILRREDGTLLDKVILTASTGSISGE